jgi:hypothetical protein
MSQVLSVLVRSDSVFTFPVIEVAIGEYDADIPVLAAEAAKSAAERRKLPRIAAALNEQVTKTASGKWQYQLSATSELCSLLTF